MSDHEDPREDLEDRLTELALGELVGERRPPDLTSRILAAAAAPPRRAARPRRALAVAACAVLAVGLAASGYAGYLLGRGQSAEQRPAVAKTHASGRSAKRRAPLVESTPPDSSADTGTGGAEVTEETGRDRLAALVDRFNAAIKEARYADAEALYHQAAEQFPGELVTKQLNNVMKMVARSKQHSPPTTSRDALAAALESVVIGTTSPNEQFGIHGILEDMYDPSLRRTPYRFGSVKAWERLAERYRLAKSRSGSASAIGRRRKGVVDSSLADELAHVPAVDEPMGYPTTEEWQWLMARRKKLKPVEEVPAGSDSAKPADADLAQRLRTPVRPDFKGIPLEEALARLAEKAGIVIRLDKPGLAQQGIDPSMPVTIDLAREISLKSTLVLILGPLNLDFDIEQGGITIRGKRPDNEAVADGDRYPHIVENLFQTAFEFPLSTFSVDVDTASYAKVRRYILQEHRLPPADAVRIEELVNYFDYSDAPPGEGAAAGEPAAPGESAPFAAHVELAACPWQPGHRLARIGIQGRVVPDEQRPPANLVYLIDVSGSMKPDDRLPRVCRAMKLLVERLRANDRVAIVTYAAESKLALPSTTGEEKERILLALDELTAGGVTNGDDGLRLAYDTAQEHFVEGGVNRVVLCTDGDFNVGLTSQDGLRRLIVERAKSGVFLTALGFGQGNHNDELLELLADKGNGNYGYIDSEDEARKLLVEQAGGTLQAIAQDVKLQIEFNPRRVAAYRLIGYEDRLLASEDFNDDAKDAGEIGSGHSVTALYELVPAGPEGDTPPANDLKYQRPAALSEAAAGDEWLTLSLRFKLPGGEASQPPLVVVGRDDERTVAKHNIAQASADLRFAAAVAGFGLLLRDSAYRGNLTYDAIIELASGALGDDPNGRRAGFAELVRETKKLAEAK